MSLVTDLSFPYIPGKDYDSRETLYFLCNGNSVHIYVYTWEHVILIINMFGTVVIFLLVHQHTVNSLLYKHVRVWE